MKSLRCQKKNLSIRDETTSGSIFALNISTFCSCSSSNQRALLGHFLLYSVYNINIVRIALIKINKMKFFFRDHRFVHKNAYIRVISTVSGMDEHTKIYWFILINKQLCKCKAVLN